ncbi:hypothetical protein JCM10908_002866 [Rhodotorula pacifica]|uniref:uncharacterized protein n=1 Tax=Rhodotorula pacifica TaxID=1495444 RepID=UPI00316C4F58
MSYTPPFPPTAGHRLRALPSPCPGCLSPRAASVIGCLIMTLLYAAWTTILYKAYTTAAHLRSSSSSTSFDEVALSARFNICTSLFCATMTLLCGGAFVVSAFPQQDVAKWLSRAIWIGWLFTWGFAIFGLAAFISSDGFVAGFCSSATCAPSRMRTATTFAVFLTLALVFYLAVVLSAYVHTLHPHLFMSPDSDTEDEYSDPDEGLERKLEDHLVSVGEPFMSHYLAAHAYHHDESRRGSRRRTPYSEKQGDDDLSEAAGPSRSSRLALSEPSSSGESGASSSTFRQKPTSGGNAGINRRVQFAPSSSSDSGSSDSSDVEQSRKSTQLYDAPARSARR